MTIENHPEGSPFNTPAWIEFLREEARLKNLTLLEFIQSLAKIKKGEKDLLEKRFMNNINKEKMAEFCNKCAEDLGHSSAEIDVYLVAETELTPGDYKRVTCEGCQLLAIGVGEDKEIMVGFPSTEKSSNPEETLVNWIYLSEWESKIIKNK